MSLKNGQDVAPGEAVYVADGGYLPHAIVWPKPVTYMEVCE